jgi:hypothetical protein
MVLVVELNTEGVDKSQLIAPALDCCQERALSASVRLRAFIPARLPIITLTPRHPKLQWSHQPNDVATDAEYQIRHANVLPEPAPIAGQERADASKRRAASAKGARNVRCDVTLQDSEASMNQM